MQRTIILQSSLSKAVITKSSSFDTHGAFVCLLWLLQGRNSGGANGPLAPGYNRWKQLLLYLGKLKLILNVVTENAGIRKEVSSIWQLTKGSLWQEGRRQIQRAESERSRGQHRIGDTVCWYKGDFSCHTFVSVKVNGVLEFLRSVKIRGFDTFSRCKSRGGGYRVSHGSTLKLSGRRRYTGFTYVTLRDTASVIRDQWGVRIQYFKVLDLQGDC